MTDVRFIVRTGEPSRCAWPEGTFLQGGDSDYCEIMRKTFVEAFPPAGGFFRGDAPTVAEAEAQCWEQYRRSVACPEHDWDARGYTNGGGFCRLCGVFGSQVFTGEQLGQFCHTCGVGTTWGQYSLAAYWDADRRRIMNPGPDEDHVWFCEAHAPCRREYEAWRAALRSVSDEDIDTAIGEISTRLARRENEES